MPTNAQIQRKHSILKPIAIAILLGYTTFSSMGFAATKASETKASAKQSVAAANQGFSSAGLQRIDSFFTDEIAQKRVPGAVVGIMRHGQLVYLKAFGQQNPDSGEPMRTDSIFAVASMTKPMVAVGALTLTQSGKLPLFSRVDSYIPEVKQMKVEIPKIGRAHV